MTITTTKAPDHGHRFAVYSATGVHVGLWSDGKIAGEVLSEYPGGYIEELVTISEAQAAIAAVVEQAAYQAKNACLVPPDGGSPTEDEMKVCDEAERRIRALAPQSALAEHDKRILAPWIDFVTELAEWKFETIRDGYRDDPRDVLDDVTPLDAVEAFQDDARTLLATGTYGQGLAERDKRRDRELFGDYGDTLMPFLAMMVKELRDNKGKGDRPGWLAMDVKTALLEIYYHLGKLQKAAKNGDLDGVREYSADVANMSMMLADIFGVLDVPAAIRAALEGAGE